ncbi:hypothetical protein [Streptomyces sp. NPDC001985]|uniref:hypothetical protein n=1 Tax=Streptomyces sp. NPDC001985 TaxID=3154406 RepID=UPI0033321E83
MEQKHIGPKIPPTHAAGVDPAYIPGLMPARPAGAGADTGETPEPETGAPPPDGVREDAVSDAVPENAPPEEAAPEESGESGKPRESEDADGSGEGGAPDEGPVFEVSDRRGAIVADGAGVTFRLDTEEAGFGWDEIKAVEFDTPRFGRRFSVTVYTSTQRWFQNDVEAPTRADLKTWAAELDAVLDARFEDSAT